MTVKLLLGGFGHPSQKRRDKGRQKMFESFMSSGVWFGGREESLMGEMSKFKLWQVNRPDPMCWAPPVVAPPCDCYSPKNIYNTEPHCKIYKATQTLAFIVSTVLSELKIFQTFWSILKLQGHMTDIFPLDLNKGGSETISSQSQVNHIILESSRQKSVEYNTRIREPGRYSGQTTMLGCC